MNWKDFAKWGAWASEWASRYHLGLRDQPVRPAVTPGALLRSLPDTPPEQPDEIEAIVADFERQIVPGMTHWQHPRFFAYFPANAAPASVLAEYLVTAMAAQCMLWQTSPAATELETRMMDWMRQAIGLPDAFIGVIQDSASSATLAAVLTMREKALSWTGNTKGLSGAERLRVYSSSEVHTSIDRAVWVSGIGDENLVRVPTVGNMRGMDPAALDEAIKADKAAGLLPCGIIACVGGTSTGAIDDVAGVCAVGRNHGLYVHVDAAWAGAAMICPEFRALWQGVEMADSVVFNPHKWLGAQFDCSAHFLRNPDELVQTLAIRPEFLKTHGRDGIINYSEWSIPLGRRFRALKIWFLLRAHGLEGLREMIRNHVNWSGEVCRRFAAHDDFEIVTEPILSLFTFRYCPKNVEALDDLNIALVNAVNDDGRIYLTQTRTQSGIAVRFQAGAFTATEEDVVGAYDVITEIAGRL